ncbi:polymorphic toxin-type HINT domain-containing protein [Micromonospora sp. NBC_01412]|uniref:polymorphic toxin-type HINT domain-containing protein n=1 Tax=Micromonospora sp. NBC_01412 TaxID=2903590 RepID=UPI003245DDF7
MGCLILAGAAAGAMASGAGFMVDVSRGDQEFSWSGLAGTMIEGGLDGALSAGLSRLGGGLRAAAGGAKAAAAAGSRLPKLGGRAAGGDGARASGGGSKATGGGGSRAASAGGSSGGSGYQGRNRQDDGSSGCTTPHSFDPSTRVLLADGSSKPIEDLKHGDEVAATDPETGRSAAKPVTQLHVNQDRDLTDLTVRDAKTGKTTVLKTTQHHPFWDATDGRWVDAAKLAVGHRLLVHDDERLEGDSTGAGMGGGGPGHDLTVVEVRNYTDDKRMHDLTVADIHTYYVIAGETPVLVHNCGGSGPAPGVIEVSGNVKSVKAFQNYSPSGRGGIEYVFDPVNNRLLVGAPKSYLGIKGSPHEQLARAGGLDEGTVLGDIFRRNANGRIDFDESSGHYGERWTSETRQQFKGFLDSFNIDHAYTPWPG